MSLTNNELSELLIKHNAGFPMRMLEACKVKSLIDAELSDKLFNGWNLIRTEFQPSNHSSVEVYNSSRDGTIIFGVERQEQRIENPEIKSSEVYLFWGKAYDKQIVAEKLTFYKELGFDLTDLNKLSYGVEDESGVKLFVRKHEDKHVFVIKAPLSVDVNSYLI